MAKGRRRKGGRPRRDGPRKNGVLLRRPFERDLGTEQIRRLREILTPGGGNLPTDPLSALFCRGLVDEASYRVGQRFRALTMISRTGWCPKDASVQDLWRRLLVGEGAEALVSAPVNGPNVTAADAARTKLPEMRAELLRGDREGAILQTVCSICVDGRWEGWCKRILCRIPELPGDWRCLGNLREGLYRLAELGTSRRREVVPPGDSRDRAVAEGAANWHPNWHPTF
jgi:hypothetical protein